MSHFYAILSRMKYINRWGLMRNTQNESICEHSLEVAILAHALAVIHIADLVAQLMRSVQQFWPFFMTRPKLLQVICLRR